MKNVKNIIAKIFTIIALFTIGCNKPNNNENGNENIGSEEDVKVTTYNPQSITKTTAICGGDAIVLQQGLSLSQVGVCWSTSESPTTENSHLSTENWNEPFVCTISELQPNTKYYVRAYALRGLICYFGDQKEFTTLGNPIVETSPLTNITSISAICGGNVLDEGSSPVIDRGVCWNTTGNPLISDNHIDSGDGIGIYTINLTNLTSGISYYVRAYAINNDGIGYGEEIVFTTLPDDTFNITIVDQFLEHTIAPTYVELASNAETLVEKLQVLKNNMTNTNLNLVCEAFLETRHQWEISQSLSFGPAIDFGIISNIDSWPIDEDAFQSLMNNPTMIAMLDSENGDVIASEQLPNNLLGFQSIEFVLFKDGWPRPMDEITDEMMIYAYAVAGNLRNRCFQLEVSWMGNLAPIDHIHRLQELGLNVTVNGSNNSYGENMHNAGQAGSTYNTTKEALLSMLYSCINLAENVAVSKIGKPYTGEDVTYIEAPYSQKSIIGFYDNIISIQNSYMGGVQGQREEEKSLHAYISNINIDLDVEISAAIENAISKIADMRTPFVHFYADASAGQAMQACQHLVNVLEEAIEIVGN